MNPTDRLLLNRVNIFMAECYENKTIISPKTLGEIFSKIFNNDVSYIKLCPSGLENSLLDLAKIINDTKDLDDFKRKLKLFIVCYYDTINFQKAISQEFPACDKDKLWLKAFWSEFVLQNLLFRDSVDLNNFKTEYTQIGTLMKNFYTEKDRSKSPIVKQMLISKLNEMSTRYKYKFALPLLSA